MDQTFESLPASEEESGVNEAAKRMRFDIFLTVKGMEPESLCASLLGMVPGRGSKEALQLIKTAIEAMHGACLAVTGEEAADFLAETLGLEENNAGRKTVERALSYVGQIQAERFNKAVEESSVNLLFKSPEQKQTVPAELLGKLREIGIYINALQPEKEQTGTKVFSGDVQQGGETKKKLSLFLEGGILYVFGQPGPDGRRKVAEKIAFPAAPRQS